MVPRIVSNKEVEVMVLLPGLEARKRKVSSSGLTMEVRACLRHTKGGFPRVRTDPGKVLTQDEIQSNSMEYNQKLIGLNIRVLHALVLQWECHCVKAEASTG